MSEDLITISTYRLESEAFIAKGALEAAGIDAVLIGHSSAINLPQQSIAGYSLQVRAGDAESADGILNQIHGVSHAEFVRPSDADEATPPSRCERCGSPDVEEIHKLVIFSALTLMIAAVFTAVEQAVFIFFAVIALGIFTLMSPRWRCSECGYRW